MLNFFSSYFFNIKPNLKVDEKTRVKISDLFKKKAIQFVIERFSQTLL